MDDDDEPIRRPPSPDTAWGRIIGRDRHLYADLWDCDLSTEEGRADYDINCKMMSHDHSEAEGIGGLKPWRNIDLEEYAHNWRPPTMSELIESLLEDERQRRAEREPPRPN